MFTIIYTKTQVILAKGNYSLQDCLDKFQFFDSQKNFDTIEDVADYLQKEHLFPSDTLQLLESMKGDYAFLDILSQEIQPISLDIFNTKGCIIFWKDKKYRLTFEGGSYNLWIRTKNLGEREIVLSREQGYSLEEEGEPFALELIADMNEYHSDIYMQAKFDNRHVL